MAVLKPLLSGRAWSLSLFPARMEDVVWFHSFLPCHFWQLAGLHNFGTNVKYGQHVHSYQAVPPSGHAVCLAFGAHPKCRPKHTSVCKALCTQRHGFDPMPQFPNLQCCLLLVANRLAAPSMLPLVSLTLCHAATIPLPASRPSPCHAEDCYQHCC